MDELRPFEEIRKIYIRKYPQLEHLSDPRYFARAAIILVAPTGITTRDLTTLARVTQWRSMQDKDTTEELTEWGKKNGY